MTASTTPCSKNAADASRGWLSTCRRLLAVLVLFLAGITAAHADGIVLRSASIHLIDEVYELNADYDLHLTGKLENALNHGAPLTFIAEFRVMKKGWVFDHEVAAVHQRFKVSYLALTQQYLLATGITQYHYSTLSDVMNALGHIDDWPVLDHSLLSKDTQYYALVRLRLDTSQLPKPLQLYALVSHDWDLSSTWRQLPLTP